jgi:integrase
MARKLEAEAMLRAKGVIDPKAEKYALWEATSLEDHAKAFEEVLRGRGVTAKHRKATLSAIRALADECGFSTPAEIDGVVVSAHIADQKRQGRGARAINSELGAFKSFCRWLVRSQRMRADPMVSVPKLNARTDRRHRRRALTDEEIGKLLEATARGGVIKGLSGPERAMLYRLALQTGLRASELGSLTPASFDLRDREQATVTVEAACSKHRRQDVLPLRPEMAKAVAAFVEGREPNTRLFRMPHKPASMLKRDLRAAKIPYRDESGRVADFHALCHTFITRLARSGVAPAVAKSLARHSTITLTMDRYTHVLKEDERSALARLPATGAESNEPGRRSAEPLSRTASDAARTHGVV